MSEKPPITTRETVAVFHALSQETRLEAYRLLLRYQPFGLTAGDISRLLSVPHNTLSTHLQILEGAGLVQSRRQGRSIVFGVVSSRLDDIVAGLEITDEKRRRRVRRGQPSSPRKRPAATSRERAMNVLVLCSGNSARSLIAEAILEREGEGRFRAYSAGSTPKARPNAAALRMLDQLGYDTARLHPKSWTEFAGPEAPEMDFVITLCDRAAGEACPDWPGHPLTVHWGVPALAERSGSSDADQDALKDTYRSLMQRITVFINLPFDDLSLAQLKDRLQAIGRLEGATEMAFSGLPERDA